MEQTALQTPLMKQYWELKNQVPDSLLFFRMGDFYELFGDDAIEASRILEITLTSRDKGKENPMPMAGFPWHSSQSYIQRLLKAGKKVAIGEQLGDLEEQETPSQKGAKKTGPKIVRREIVRQFTPGVQFDHEGSEACFLGVIAPIQKAGKKEEAWILACLDASTGECLVSTALSSEQLAEDIGSLPIKHLLRTHESFTDNENLKAATASSQSMLVETLSSNYLSGEQAGKILKSHYKIDNLEAFFTSPEAVLAVAALVLYTLRTQQQEKLPHLRIPAPLHRPQTLVLGPRTAQHLDLLPVADGTPNLFSLINRTRSALGARQLRRWLLAPLINPEMILQRQLAVKELCNPLAKHSARVAENLSSAMAEVYDLERILGRINTGLANPRDTLALGKSLGVIPLLIQKLGEPSAQVLVEFKTLLSRLQKDLCSLGERIITTQKEDAPFVARDSGVFKIGTNPELDRLIGLNEDGQKWLIDLETRERESTGISSLKVRYNRVFGYYIEITSTHLKNVPAHYQRKQTTVGGERFFTEELKKFEDEIVHAVSRQKSLELELFEELLLAIRSETLPIMEYAQVLGELDSLVSLSRLSQDSGWSFPEIDASLDLEIQQGRHPLVDSPSNSFGRGKFVPNDLSLSPTTRLTLMITGPNMGGKSTIMRQTALIILLGQMGAPVPAAQARWGSVSSLYTRIGAHDAIARGQSTFMVEMSELAHILHRADERSLIVLDEIGRGTSTYDGISVAWSTLEWICSQIRARTLFATHYHELIRLSDSLPLLANAHMAVESETGEGARPKDFRFLYLLKEGATNDSFGIQVAQLAGLPHPVIERAWKVLDELEKSSISSPQTRARLVVDPLQLPLFLEKKPEPHPVLAEIEKLDPNAMTPLEALNWLAKLQGMSRGSAEVSSSKQNQ
jgi:DNA mismatch repair protein MutS